MLKCSHHLISVFVFISVLPIIHAVSECITSKMNSSISKYSLPKTTRPTHYHLEVTTQIENDHFSFSGIAIIYIEALTDTNSITLHAKHMVIQSISLHQYCDWLSMCRLEKDEIEIQNYTFIDDEEFLQIHLRKGVYLRTNYKYVLIIMYKVIKDNGDHGFQRLVYKDDNNITG